MALVPKNWKKFQHYKDRSPGWIKLHHTLLDNVDYHMLSAEAGKALPLVWLLASEKDGPLPPTNEIAWRLRNAGPTMEQIVVELIERGFLVDEAIDAEQAEDGATLAQRIAKSNGFGSRHIPDKTKREVWLRDCGKCRNCGSEENIEYDHITPVSKGGGSERENIQLLCRSCNRAKRVRDAAPAEKIAPPAQQPATQAENKEQGSRSLEERRGEAETQEQTEGHSPSSVADAPAAGARRVDLDFDDPVTAKAVTIVILPKLFEDFWGAYPAREGRNPKEPARKKFIAAVKSGEDADAIIAGARGYAEEIRRANKSNTPFVAQAVTWLGEKSWRDYQPQIVAPATLDPDPGVSIDPAWASPRERLLAELGPNVFASWFRNVTFLGKTDDGRVRMAAPTRFIKDWIEKDYMPQLLRAWRPSMPEIIAVEIVTASGPLAA